MRNLKAIRLERGLTQQELATGANVGQAAISRYESGELTPRLEVAIKLANYLNVRVDELIDQPHEGQQTLC